MSKRKFSTLDNFVYKKEVPKPNQELHPLESSSITKQDSESKEAVVVQQELPSCSSQDGATSKASPTSEEGIFTHGIDIGQYIDKTVSDLKKYNILKYTFVPDTNFDFPYSLHDKNNKKVKCYLSKKHFNDFGWLIYSKKYEGLFCKFCALFVHHGGMNRTTPLQKLVKSPLAKYSKLYGKDGDLFTHDKHLYHKNAIIYAENFLQTYENPNIEISNLLDTERQKQITENRTRLIPIIESIIFLGKQNIPFRGHRDYGPLIREDGSASVINEGNFRELLRFRVSSGDNNLKLHLQNSSSKATYISNTVQNEIIQCIGDEILNHILERIKQSKYYSIIFDETTDISHSSQMSLILRYVSNEREVCENFLAFVDCHDENFDDFTKEPILSGEVLSNTVISFIQKCGLDFNACVGIGTDGCSVMLSEQKGAVSNLQRKLINAIKCPCFNHALNLSISKSISVHSVRNAMGIMKEVITFFNSSAKRNKVLLYTNNETLIKLCDTRWVEKHESILRFQNSLYTIVESLNLISQWKDRDSASKADCLKKSLLSSNFIVSLHCLSDILSVTLSLSKLLQKHDLDVESANRLVTNTLDLLKGKRNNSEACFQNIYLNITEAHSILNIPILVPRTTSRQVHRPNVISEKEDDYFRISIYIPLLDNIISDLEFRFNTQLFKVLDLNLAIPSIVCEANFCDKNIQSKIDNVSKYLHKFTNETESFLKLTLKSELELWAASWGNKDSKPDSPLKGLAECNKELFPTIYTMLHILCTLPVSVASSERSFSSLKRLKTWLRSNMSQDRLNGLALMHINRNYEIDINNVLDRFSKGKSRKLELIL